ncbi:MAG: glycoside hydrolase family 2 TIM barrel-domain containing protein [Pseudobacter sp.]|uniref:glycoside hydrolase family 2 TIM barrel-domain containing protein n=1 Tax=Pseudobacter sp. TaxID=2045420 RepID=UPI003F7E375E
MRKIALYFFVFLYFYFPAHSQHGARKNFDEGWKFRLDSVNNYSATTVSDGDWRSLDLPHDWSIEGRFSKDHPATYNGGALPGGIGWYRKTFTLPAADADKQVYISFDGIYCNSEVWINGNYLGKRAHGYVSFQYDLTPWLHADGKPNTIAVKVSNNLQPNSRWYSGSGIYRHVWLTTLNKSSIKHWGTFAISRNITKNNSDLQIETKVQNAGSARQKLVLLTTVYDQQHNKVASENKEITALPGVAMPVVQTMKITNPHLWSVNDPYLYTVESVLQSSEGRELDKYQTTHGIRYFNMDKDKGFSLNGEHLKIRGVCNHHDLGALGTAVNTRAIERQLELLKAMGCNAIRTSHNPPAPELLDLCDKMGFIVMNETFDMWRHSKTNYDYSLYWDEEHQRDIRDHILRDRNHPSVIFWSIGNEIIEQWGDSTGMNMALELSGIVRALDSTRIVVSGNNEAGPYNNLIRSGMSDVVGYNYNTARWLSFHQDWPGKKLIITESTSALETRGHYDKIPFDTVRRWPLRWDLPLVDGNADNTVSAYDHVSAPWGSTHEESLKLMENNEHVSGMFVWTGFDYLGEPTPYTWPSRSSYFGIIDLAGFPKDVYYLYQSVWTDKPVLHVYPHWNWKRGDTLDVVAYYNQADEVELFLNGKSLGKQRKEKDNMHVKWRVPYTSGTVKAISRKAGKVVLTKEIKTAGAPAALQLLADRNTIAADGKDLSYITVKLVDKKGVLIPDANQLVKFSVTGPGFIAGVDNGDPVSHEPFKADQHKLMAGMGLVILQSTGKPGLIRLSASIPGLPETSIEIEVR